MRVLAPLLVVVGSGSGCGPSCGAGTELVAGECVAVATEDFGADTGSGNGEEVLFEEDFDGSMGEWDITDPGGSGAECWVEDEAYRMAIWLPQQGQVPYCYLRLERSFDLRDYSEAWIDLDYDVTHYADQDGAEDGAAIYFAITDGDVDGWLGAAWSLAEGEDHERSGTLRTDLEDFVGWSSALEAYVRLALYSCGEASDADCGDRNWNDDEAWITVDNFSLSAR